MRTARGAFRRCCPVRGFRASERHRLSSPRSGRHPRGRIAACAIGAIVAGAASAESWEFTFSRDTLTPENPSTTVTLWAKFDPSDWAFASSRLSMHANEPGWSDPVALFDWSPGQVPGTLSPDGRSVEQINVGQLWTFGRGPDPFNPIAAWQATFTVTDFSSPRDITLSTMTDAYNVYPVEGRLVEPRMPIDIETVIRVIPAPASLALFVLAGLTTARRRTP